MSADGALSDSFGLCVTTTLPACLAAVNSYYEAVLAYKPFSAWAISEEAVSLDARCPLARVLAADYAFCRGDVARAKALLEECASDLAAGSGASWSWREERYVRAWHLWCTGGDPVGCYDVLKEVLQKHPEDLFAVKRGQIMGLIVGDGAKIAAVAELAAAAVPPGTTPPRFLHGMLSFGLEQQGSYELAEERAREGLKFEEALGPDAWLDHSLAHSLYFQGEDRMDDALEYLEARSSNWSPKDLHPFLYTHNWWHLALLYVEGRKFDKAIQIFDTRLWTDAEVEMQKDPQVQLNAFNLLWRLDTRGQRDLTLPRWKKVLAGCVGTSLPSADETPGSCQHGDFLLDVLLVRALCATTSAGATAALDKWLTQVAAKAEEAGKGAGEGAAERAEAYAGCARAVAELFRADLPEASLAARHHKAREQLRALQPRWGSLGNSVEQRSVLLEAIEGPLVCGEVEKNYDTLFH